MRIVALSLLCACLSAQAPQPNPLPVNVSKTNESSFRKIDSWPTPNEYRAGSGAPGHAYWQQKVDYKIKATLDDANQSIRGSEEITYKNNSPDELRYLWMQLDQNLQNSASVGRNSRNATNLGAQAGDDKSGITFTTFNSLTRKGRAEGFHIHSVKDATGRDLKFTINDTMMRVDLPAPLASGQIQKFSVTWDYMINDYATQGGRSGFEKFEDGQILYNLAQWQPRLVAYTDDMGWQHQQYLGQGEFTLEFGDWDVEITLPYDHVMLATGELQNAAEVLTQKQRDRLVKARTSKDPVFIVAPDEVMTAGNRPTKSGTLTWKFKATNVRDFAMDTSRRLIWDAMGVKINDRIVMAQSGYTKEGMPLWDKYSTRVVAHTLKVYGRYTFDYPYPSAASCLGLGGGGGMEYPMICFNGPRPEKDGTYSERTKNGLVGVIIHEVGHNFFPMIVNSDERQWSWMDEGLNTFLEYLAEKEWDPNFPSSRGPVSNIVDYLKFPDATPIMTQSDAVRHFGFNAYAKPAAGLNMLRETIMGRELFDYSFKEYARRWKFKRPQPADLFRTMNDASGVDLDWFWRGWFYTTLAPDLSIEVVETFQISDGDPVKQKARSKEAAAKVEANISRMRDKDLIPEGGAERVYGAEDFYTTYDRFGATNADKEKYNAMLAGLTQEEKDALASKKYMHRITVKNVGKFVMPIILKLDYKDGSTEVVRVPVQAWLQNEERFAKLIVSDKELVSVELDPYQEIPDVDRSNDAYPRKAISIQPLNLQKQQTSRPPNPMQLKAAEEAAAKKKADGSKATEEKKP